MIKKREYPTLALEQNKILKVVDTISKFGGSASKSQIAEDIGIKQGLGTIIASAKQYNLIKREEGSVNLILTELGKEYCSSDEDTKKFVIMKIILNVPHYKKLVEEKNFYKEPSLSVLRQIMEEYGIPKKDAGAVAGIFRRNLSAWGFTFQDLKQFKIQYPMFESDESDIIEGLPELSVIPAQKTENKLISGIKLAWTISYLKFLGKELNKQVIKSILHNMLSQATIFKELTKEIEATIKFSQYSDEKNIIAYIKDNFERALTKDLGVENISDLFETKEKKAKIKKEENKFAEGESAKDETGDEPK